jgi:hypothetical protein
MRNLPEHIKVCIELCWQCRNTCQDTFYNHCLDQGGAHVAHQHALLMNDCIQACQTAADFMVRGSAHHVAECAACAEICEACAVSCETFDCDEIKRCAEVCRRCSQSCSEMSHMNPAAERMAAE